MTDVISEIVLRYHDDGTTPKVIRRIYKDNPDMEIMIFINEQGNNYSIHNRSLRVKTYTTYYENSRYIKSMSNHWFDSDSDFMSSDKSENVSCVYLYYKDMGDYKVATGVDIDECGKSTTIYYNNYFIIIHLEADKDKDKRDTSNYKILYRDNVRLNYGNYETNYGVMSIILAGIATPNFQILKNIFKFLIIKTFSKYLNSK